MAEILSNIVTLGPWVIGAWAVVLALLFWKPWRFRNSFFLLAALGLTALFVAGLFGSNMGYALLVMMCAGSLIILIVPALLVFNGMLMMRREGRSLGNLLSLFLGALLGALELFLLVRLYLDITNALEERLSVPILVVGSAVFFLSIVFVAFVLYSLLVQVNPLRKHCDFIIVHGCGLLGGSRVSPLLAGRIDKAIQLWKRSGCTARIIASGGRGGDEACSEAEAIARYLREHDVPEEAILLEDQSTTTQENLANSEALIEASGVNNPRVVLVSSNYHVYRCLLYARQMGLRCEGAGGRVAWYYWPSAIIREFVAVFSHGAHLAWLCIGLVFFAGTPLLSLLA